MASHKHAAYLYGIQLLKHVILFKYNLYIRIWREQCEHQITAGLVQFFLDASGHGMCNNNNNALNANLLQNKKRVQPSNTFALHITSMGRFIDKYILIKQKLVQRVPLYLDLIISSFPIPHSP